MLETDDLTVLKNRELAIWHAKARNAAPQFEILAENEWRMRSIKTQYKLHKRIVIITAIISALSGIFGGLVQRYIPAYHPLELQRQTQIQTSSNKDINTQETTHLKGSDDGDTMHESISSKQPPNQMKKPAN